MDPLTSSIAKALGDLRNGPPRPLTEEVGREERQCATHGPYQAVGTRYLIGLGREVWTVCPGCEKQRQEDDRAAAELARRRAEAAQFEELLGQAAIPARFLGRSFDTYQTATDGQREALEAVRAYADGFDSHARTGESLLLIGARGTGKSHLAAATLQAILPKYIGMYCTVPDLIDKVRDTWRRDSTQSQDALLGTLARVPLLVLDEIGVQYGTESEQHTLFQIIDRRYRERRPMVLLTNQDVGSLRETLGDRSFDRLREIAQVIRFDWESYRAQARKESLE